MTLKHFNIDKIIVLILYYKVENRAVIATGNTEIISKNEAAFKQIKLMQELVMLYLI